MRNLICASGYNVLRACGRETEINELDVRTFAAARLVCRRWRSFLSSACFSDEISPASLETVSQLAAFPAVTALDLRRAAPRRRVCHGAAATARRPARPDGAADWRAQVGVSVCFCKGLQCVWRMLTKLHGGSQTFGRSLLVYPSCDHERDRRGWRHMPAGP